MNENVNDTTALALDTATACRESPTVTTLEWPVLFDRIGRHAMRFGLVVVIAWIGAMKFTSYEAEGIAPFVVHSPLLGWVYEGSSHGQFSSILGVVELVIAVLLATGLYWPRLALPGALGAVGMFLTTLSFMITTPGVFEPAAGGFPALSAMPGQFLVKDAALLGISLRLVADAMRAPHGQSELHLCERHPEEIDRGRA